MKHARAYASLTVLLAALGFITSVVAAVFDNGTGGILGRAAIMMFGLFLLVMALGLTAITWALTADLDLGPLAEEELAALTSLDYDEDDSMGRTML